MRLLNVSIHSNFYQNRLINVLERKKLKFRSFTVLEFQSFTVTEIFVRCTHRRTYVPNKTQYENTLKQNVLFKRVNKTQRI